jgi:orotate phosphoribosyltransferase
MANQKIIEKISIQSAEILIDIGSVNFNVKKRFKLTSGKLSPVYCDCRRIISFPSERKKLINFLIKKLKSKDYFKSINNISGGETAGIPFASFVSSKLNLPMTYIRKQKKEFGRKEQIEGIIKEKDEVLLIEDLITDGGSKWDFLKAVKEKKAITRAIAVIFKN